MRVADHTPAAPSHRPPPRVCSAGEVTGQPVVSCRVGKGPGGSAPCLGLSLQPGGFPGVQPGKHSRGVGSPLPPGPLSLPPALTSLLTSFSLSAPHPRVAIGDPQPWAPGSCLCAGQTSVLQGDPQLGLGSQRPRSVISHVPLVWRSAACWPGQVGAWWSILYLLSLHPLCHPLCPHPFLLGTPWSCVSVLPCPSSGGAIALVPGPVHAHSGLILPVTQTLPVWV